MSLTQQSEEITTLGVAKGSNIRSRDSSPDCPRQEGTPKRAVKLPLPLSSHRRSKAALPEGFPLPPRRLRKDSSGRSPSRSGHEKPSDIAIKCASPGGNLFPDDCEGRLSRHLLSPSLRFEIINSPSRRIAATAHQIGLEPKKL